MAKKPTKTKTKMPVSDMRRAHIRASSKSYEKAHRESEYRKGGGNKAGAKKKKK